MKQIFLKLLPIAVNWGKNNLVVDVVEQKVFYKRKQSITIMIFEYSEIFGIKFNKKKPYLKTIVTSISRSYNVPLKYTNQEC
jgi:hypothetical protein